MEELLDQKTLDKTIGENIRSLREEYNMKQVELAQQIHVHRSVISKIETGDRSVTHSEIEYMSRLFDVSILYIMGLTDRLESNSELINSVKSKEEEMFKPLLNLLVEEAKFLSQNILSNFPSDIQDKVARNIYNTLKSRKK